MHSPARVALRFLPLGSPPDKTHEIHRQLRLRGYRTPTSPERAATAPAPGKI